ncbi:putative Type III pantothenate kinase [Candidatus Zixiibacteriota bacterium]|nr:putative Type III pantothenate kinase [candidate division Zixibacteria bacterium]
MHNHNGLTSLYAGDYIKNMMVAIDIGNSNTCMGLFDGERLVQTRHVQSSGIRSSEDTIQNVINVIRDANIATADLNLMAIASVVPFMTPLYEAAADNLQIKRLTLSTEMKSPLTMGYHTPNTLGVDRLANAVAGYSKFGGPILIVDYGTAIKFDAVTDNGIYLGGAIAPGPVTAGASLSEKAAQLFEVDIIRPERAIGRSSIECLRSGLFYGIVGMVDHIISVIVEEWTVHPRIIATGGLAAKFAGESRFIEMTLPNLTLEGIRIVAQYQFLDM